MNSHQVTFETKCYEKDWQFILTTDRLQRMIAYNNYPFAEKILFINNVSDVSKVAAYAEKLINNGDLTAYYIVDDYKQKALEFFNIAEDSFKGGYYYSIAELVSIYLCRTEYLLHFSGDSMLQHPFHWIDKAIATMELQSAIKVANPTWNQRYWEAKQDADAEDLDFYISHGFSDQCYLIKALDFQGPIYNETHPMSERYPRYGGELFEKRVDAWMRNHHFQRITYKYGSYIHHSISNP